MESHIDICIVVIVMLVTTDAEARTIPIEDHEAIIRRSEIHDVHVHTQGELSVSLIYLIDILLEILGSHLMILLGSLHDGLHLRYLIFDRVQHMRILDISIDELACPLSDGFRSPDRSRDSGSIDIQRLYDRLHDIFFIGRIEFGLRSSLDGIAICREWNLDSLDGIADLPRIDGSEYTIPIVYLRVDVADGRRISSSTTLQIFVDDRSDDFSRLLDIIDGDIDDQMEAELRIVTRCVDEDVEVILSDLLCLYILSHRSRDRRQVWIQVRDRLASRQLLLDHSIDVDEYSVRGRTTDDLII